MLWTAMREARADEDFAIDLEREKPPVSLGEEIVVIPAIVWTEALIGVRLAATCRSIGCGVLVGPNDEEHFRRVQDLEMHVVSAKS
jgi:hypothetical protein